MDLFSWGEKIFRSFSVCDIALFKLYLFSLGLIAGAYLSDWVKKRIWWVAAAAILSGAWMVYKLFG